VRKVQAISAHHVAAYALDHTPDGSAERAALAEAEQRAADEQAAADNEAAAKAAQLSQANEQSRKAEVAHGAALQSAIDARKALTAAESAAASLQSVGCATLPGGVLPCRLIDDARQLAATIAAQREAVASAESAEQAAAKSSEAALAERNNVALAAATAQARAGECRQKHAAALAEARRAVTDAERAHATREREAVLAITQRTAAVQAADAAEEAARVASQRFGEATTAEREAHRAFEAAPEPTGEHAEAIDEARAEYESLRALTDHVYGMAQSARESQARTAALVQQYASAINVDEAQAALDSAQAAELEACAQVDAASKVASQICMRRGAAHNTACARRDAAARSHGAATQARAQAGQLAAHAAQLAEQAHEAKRWSWLAGSLRRLASLTVDASRAAIEARINAFLARCWGARFSVALEPETINKGGESTRRQYEIVVTDADCDGQQDRAFSTYCGGEQVALRQAIQWALLILAAERTPAQWGIAIIDEADAALSDAAQLDWQNMLAALVATSGLSQVYTVTHRGLDVASGTIELGRHDADPTA